MPRPRSLARSSAVALPLIASLALCGGCSTSHPASYPSGPTHSRIAPDGGPSRPGSGCAEPFALGERCDSHAHQNECGLDAYCDWRTDLCSARLPAGASCFSSCRGWGCAQPDDCARGTFCRLDVNICTQRPEQVGAPCAISRNAFACGADLACVGGRCAASDPNSERTLGQWCTSGWLQCARGLFCAPGQRCATAGQRGESCEDSRECSRGLVCSPAHVCADAPMLGEPCLDRCAPEYRCPSR